MSNPRLINHWGASLFDAFGEVGKKARLGEQFVMEAVKSWGWLVEDHESDIELQKAGHDISIKNPEKWSRFYSVDVKTNMDYVGTFFVESNEDGWLFNPKKTSDRIWHVNVETGWMAWYGRENMIKYIEQHNMKNLGLLNFTIKVTPDFVTRSRYVKPPQEPKVHLGDIST